MDCVSCGGSAVTYLCFRCQATLVSHLSALAHPLLGWLDDEAHGATRKGDSARRSGERGSPMLAHLEAAQLRDRAHAVLAEWTRDICEYRGVNVDVAVLPFMRPAQRRNTSDWCEYTSETLARFLAHHSASIACDAGADVALREFIELCADIVRCINRPHSPREYGPCPGVRETGETCRAWLYGPRGADTVHCARCDTVFDAESLAEAIMPLVDEFALTRDLTISAMDMLCGRSVSRSLWHQWRPHLTPVSWRTPSGRRSMIRGHGDEPEYLFGDVRRLAATRGARNPVRNTPRQLRCDTRAC